MTPTALTPGASNGSSATLATAWKDAGESVVVGVYLYNRLWRFGQAELVLEPHDTPSLVYRAPALPFLRGRILLRPGASTPG